MVSSFGKVLLLGMVMFLFSGWKYKNTKPEVFTLKNSILNLTWSKDNKGWKLSKLKIKVDGEWKTLTSSDAEYLVLYNATKPDTAPLPIYDTAGSKIDFPEPVYKFVTGVWKEITSPVQMNEAGEPDYFYPKKAKMDSDGTLVFSSETSKSVIQSAWSMDKNYSSDINVVISLTAKADGYYSIASPAITTVSEDQLSWGVIPGHFQGATIEKDFVKAFVYGQGIPDRPLLVRERTASTLSPCVTNKDGITIAVIPEPGTGRNPWTGDQNTHSDWELGMSLMNRKHKITPTIYHPVLGEKGSYLKAGETRVFKFRYSITTGDWFTATKHASQDIYKFADFLKLKKAAQSLTDRVLAMHKYVVNDTTSMWRTEQFNSTTIGAQAYLGGVVGSVKDAMKNSDYGAMWMLATVMDDSILKTTRLPYARNFKLEQQQISDGFFKGAVIGQYYLSKSKKFTEEYGPYVEPIGLTYYNLIDIGNILLFDPEDSVLKSRFIAGADKLLEWQNNEGKWQVAYDRETTKPLFTELEDLRPTFYGLVVAYRILKDEKYLIGARKGADWYIKNAINKGHFLGVCGDTRFVPDFATVQSAQALLDLYDVTKDKTYQDAAIKAAQFYTTSIYTHPIPNREIKTVNGVKREDWEISQVGLSFEHGGAVGSANTLGPILLASHAGLFVRIYQLTKDSIYLNMARAAVLGRDAFVDDKTKVASYYWKAMNAGPGEYPHHAWWQIGWITDYLLSEVEMHSNGKITFPRGFMTPKVGPHEAYGFAPGSVYGRQAKLVLKEGMLKSKSPYLDYIGAVSTDSKAIYFILLNDSSEPLKTTIDLDVEKIISTKKVNNLMWLSPEGKGIESIGNSLNIDVSLPAYGLKVLRVE
ncbi:Glycerophosphoryl diester phosphodiesterase [Arcticibacter svalbardensis MN12-7]|uniref:Glycerophosphoryl diester phosphodiesterase n=1 Tax=Arcticibacter svalbardensis MN12-7 TaxID=1150600 RepID=R9GQS5_9SPHI|nr:glycerophosphoryl diester phosphodiesterase [Arcticibacter svalbardensis]EOR94157.1 Glycerophosphoryl diester phosphodiesterase [Arcticibacter svalbardensis MN12-7]